MELDIQMKASDLYDYLLMHNYSKASGLLGSCVGAMAVIIGLARSYVLFVILGLALLVYLPWTLFIRSRQQALNNPAYKKPLHYLLDDTGITVSQDEVTQHADWDQVRKAMATGQSIIVYTGKNNACIFPNRETGEKRADLVEMISTHVPPARVRIRN